MTKDIPPEEVFKAKTDDEMKLKIIKKLEGIIVWYLTKYSIRSWYREDAKQSLVLGILKAIYDYQSGSFKRLASAYMRRELMYCIRIIDSENYYRIKKRKR